VVRGWVGVGVGGVGVGGVGGGGGGLKCAALVALGGHSSTALWVPVVHRYISPQMLVTICGVYWAECF